MPARSPPAAVVQLVGRQPGKTHATVCGEYTLISQPGEALRYRQAHSKAFLCFHAAKKLWVITLAESALQIDLERALAFAAPGPGPDLAGLGPELTWLFFEGQNAGYALDLDVMAVVAPTTVQVVGQSEWAASMVGEYTFSGVLCGRPTYAQGDGPFGLLYGAESDRWLLVREGTEDGACQAYSSSVAGREVWDADLDWFVPTAKERAVLDPTIKVLVCPIEVHVLGRSKGKSSQIITGTYRLCGAWCGRPKYVKLDRSAVLQYSAVDNVWKVQNVPSWLELLLSYLRGTKGEECVAYAKPTHLSHPGSCELRWNVYEWSAGAHVRDSLVRCTCAPPVLHVWGRGPGRCYSNEICGIYTMVGAHSGRPVYRVDGGGDQAIRFWAPTRQWLLDLAGVRDTSACVAYAEADEADYPSGLLWFVYEVARGTFLPDPEVSVGEWAEPC